MAITISFEKYAPSPEISAKIFQNLLVWFGSPILDAFLKTWIPPLNIEWNGIPDQGGEIQKKLKSGTPLCAVTALMPIRYLVFNSGIQRFANINIHEKFIPGTTLDGNSNRKFYSYWKFSSYCCFCVSLFVGHHEGACKPGSKLTTSSWSWSRNPRCLNTWDQNTECSAHIITSYLGGSDVPFRQ